MTEQFNRINQGFGANRVRLLSCSSHQMMLEVVGWATFLLRGHTGEVMEYNQATSTYSFTARSRWVQAISEGKKRNDAGEVA